MTNLTVYLRTWYKNGQLQESAMYKDDTPDGLCEVWYDNGQPQESTMYKDGKPDKAFN